jgi:hypothetical protein
MTNHTRQSRFAVLLFLFGLGIQGRGLAQNYSIDWHAITAGGGTSSNAIYTVSGSVGQTASAHSVGGRFTIDSGFWAFAAAIQTPGAPFLTLRRSSATTLTISWPSSATDFVLQSTADLKGQWSGVAGSPVDDGTAKSLVVNLTPGNQFFRLIKYAP